MLLAVRSKLMPVLLILWMTLALGHSTVRAQQLVSHLQYPWAPWYEGYSDTLSFNGPVQAGNAIPAGSYHICNGDGDAIGVAIQTSTEAPAGTVIYVLGAIPYRYYLVMGYTGLADPNSAKHYPNGIPWGQPLASNRMAYTLNDDAGNVVGDADGGGIAVGQCLADGQGPTTVAFPTSFTVYYTWPSDPPPRSPEPPHPNTLEISGTEAAPAQHRKVALNGRPLPDGKPQTEAESDTAKEETYVDAFSLGLRHDTTDIYVPIPNTDLALQVRRSTTPEVWSQLHGLQPGEMPDRPFGNAWTSNLGACIHFVRHDRQYAVSITQEADYAYVTDEDGSTSRFLILNDPAASIGQETYLPLPGARDQQETYLNSLKPNGPGQWIFQRKYGTRVVFADAGINLSIPGDRVTFNPIPSNVHSYARITQVIDRTGVSLAYTYSASSGTLIPSQITVVPAGGNASASLVQQLNIQSDTQGRVQTVADPRNNVWHYAYQQLDYT